jgi:uncharacterized protein (TIGR03083 family)
MDWIAAIEHQGHALSVAARHDPKAEVPACPGWDVDELLRHVGGAHHNATVIVGERRTERPDRRDPPPHAGSLDWYETGLAALLDVLRATDPTTPVWTFGADGTAAFWSRRMAHETTIHRVDAEQATGGRTPVPIELAVDGIAESLDVFLPMMAKRRGSPAGGTLHLHVTDAEGEWLLRFGEGQVDVEVGHAKGDAAVRGTAEDLELWIWGRAGIDRLEVFGDTTLADRLTAITRV